MSLRALVVATLVIVPAADGSAPVPLRVAVFPVALNDLSNQPASPELPDRMRRLTEALRERLAAACGYQAVPVDTTGLAKAGFAPGSYYEHPEVAIGLTGPVEADWVIIPRLNRASPWVTDLQAHVVRVSDSTIVSNRIVEVKGIELTAELANRLIDRGSAWMADQLSQAIEYATTGAAGASRRCAA